MTPPPKRRGRPPVDPDDASVHVAVTLAARQFDRLCAEASERKTSLAEVIRRLVAELKFKK